MHSTIRELRIVVAHRTRTAGRFDDPWDVDAADPSIDDVLGLTGGKAGFDRWVLTGGEPTLRPDLPLLIGALAAAGAPDLVLRTDGLALSRAAAVQTLAAAGLVGVRIPLSTGRADAQDWLMNLPGACRTARQAIETCLGALPHVEVEVVITRPTMPYLAETVALIRRAGVQHIRFRALAATGPAADAAITLVPRYGLLQPVLEDAIQTALRHDMTVHVEGIPRCVVPKFPDVCCPTDATQWAVPAATATAAAASAPSAVAAGPGCAECPGPPACIGAPPHYAARFGWAEFSSEGAAQARAVRVQPLEPPASGDRVYPPPPRQGRQPSTRVAAAVRQAQRISLGGDPMAGRAPIASSPQTITVEFGVDEPTRDIRQRLVHAAQHGAGTLRIDGASLSHPAALELLREALRLSFDAVEVAGPAHHMSGCPDAHLFHLRGLARFDIVLHAADAQSHDQITGQAGSFDAACAVAERISRLTGIEVGIVPDCMDPSTVSDLEAACAAGALPPLAPPPAPVN